MNEDTLRNLELLAEAFKPSRIDMRLSPDTVLALIAEIRSLRAENATLVRRARGLEDDLETANETIAALSAQIDETPYSSIWKFVHGTDSTETRQIVRAWLDSNTGDYDEVQP